MERNRCQENRGIPQRHWREDMPRKSLDIRFSDYPVSVEKGQLRPFPAFRRGRVRAEPENGSRGWSPYALTYL